MSLTSPNESQAKKPDSEQEYRALVRSLKYTEGFGLLFVQCSPSVGERLMACVKQEIPQKRIEILSFMESIETLYDKVEAICCDNPIDVLFVRGIEHSLYAYEKNRLWSDDAQRLRYGETGIPRLLQHLNLNRERFQADFAVHFIFLVPYFALKYLTRRAPDFFDWNSGVLEFAMEREQLLQESIRAADGKWEEAEWDLASDECRKKILDIQALIDEPYQSIKCKANLFFEQGRLFVILEEHEEAVISFDKSLQLNLDNDEAWVVRGIALGGLGRYEAAIASFDKSLQLKPDDYAVWQSRGKVFFDLGCYEEAIASYDKALQLKPTNFAFYNKARCYSLLANTEAAIENLSHAIIGSSDRLCQALAKTDSAFDSIRENERFQALLTL